MGWDLTSFWRTTWRVKLLLFGGVHSLNPRDKDYRGVHVDGAKVLFVFCKTLAAVFVRSGFGVKLEVGKFWIMSNFCWNLPSNLRESQLPSCLGL